MAEYAFYARMLRFVAAKSDRADARVAAMMALIEDAAVEVETRGAVTVAAGQRELMARALAGVAGFLQQRILPEAVAHGNTAGERDIRWAVDAAMDGVNLLLRETSAGTAAPVELRLPPPPGP